MKVDLRMFVNFLQLQLGQTGVMIIKQMVRNVIFDKSLYMFTYII